MPSGGRARFIVIEGLDAVGTTTHAGLLAESLRAADQRVLLTAEPTDGPVGAILRAHVRGEIGLDPATAALAFAADRSDHLEREIRPALAAGETVVCDRYLLSTLAYQGAGGVDRAWILDVSGSARIPDLTAYLDVPEPQRAERIATRDRHDRYDDPVLAADLRSSYEVSIDLLRRRGHTVEIVDASGSPESTAGAIRSLFDALP